MKFCTSTRYTHTLTLDGGAEVELNFEPAYLHKYRDMLVERVGNKLVVAYLVQDDDCENPLESCDGMGEIVGRGKYATRHATRDESDVLKAMGLDTYGGPDCGPDPVERRVDELFRQHLRDMGGDAWSEVYDLLFGQPGVDDYSVQQATEVLGQIRAAVLEYDLSECDYDEAEVFYQALSWLDLGDSNVEFPWNGIRTAISFDVEAAQEKAWQGALDAGEIGDPDAVLLDVYDHSGLAWSIHGGGMQCRWDTSGGAGMWFPDASCLDEIDRRAPVYAFAYITGTRYLRGKGNSLCLKQVRWNEDGPVHADVEAVAFSDSWGELWDKAKEIAAGREPTSRQLRWARRMAAEELAQQALDEYNKWLSGDCYGCVVETFELCNPDCDHSDEQEWEQVDEDSCWGFVGDDYAMESLRDQFYDRVVADLKQALLAQAGEVTQLEGENDAR